MEKVTGINHAEYRLAAIGGTIGGFYLMITLSQLDQGIMTDWGGYVLMVFMQALLTCNPYLLLLFR